MTEAQKFQAMVTLDRRASHRSCWLAQLNRFVRDESNTTPGWYYDNEYQVAAVEASDKGECGVMKTWGYCKLSIQNGSPAAPTNLPQAAPNVNRETMVVDIITAAVQDSIELAVSQRFNDGNHRTALLSLLETVTYAGLHITPDVDIFRLYINLKSLTEKIGLIDRTKRKVQIVLNPTPEQKEKQDADMQKATKEFEDNKTLVKGEMVKLMKDVVRISPSPQVPNAPITFLDRMGLIHMAKFYVPIQVKEVETYRGDLLKAVVAIEKNLDLKRAKIHETNKKCRKEQPALYRRYKYMYPKHNLMPSKRSRPDF